MFIGWPNSKQMTLAVDLLFVVVVVLLFPVANNNNETTVMTTKTKVKAARITGF